ncbi:MAG: hypothetical protein IPG89_04025 [Bacteroidetes bacterium]|nr:hypothetical protein [Bacteroidota bacterium]
MPEIELNFTSIISKAKGKLTELGNSNESKIKVTASDIEVLEKLHTASCSTIFFTIENQNKTHLFIPDAFSPFIINKNNFEACFFNTLEGGNDKLIANYFYGDSLIVEFEKHVEIIDLSNPSLVNINKKSKNELVIPFYETKLRITY